MYIYTNVYINNTMVLLIIGSLGCFYPLVTLSDILVISTAYNKINDYSLKITKNLKFNIDYHIIFKTWL